MARQEKHVKNCKVGSIDLGQLTHCIKELMQTRQFRTDLLVHLDYPLRGVNSTEFSATIHRVFCGE